MCLLFLQPISDDSAVYLAGVSATTMFVKLEAMTGIKGALEPLKAWLNEMDLM